MFRSRFLKIALMGFLVVAGKGFLLSAHTMHEQENSAQFSLPQVLNLRIKEAIEHAQEIPGLNVEEFSFLKVDIARTWNLLMKEGVLEVRGPDKQVRPPFVALQGIIEHVLASELKNSIGFLEGRIHTPMPATPLCTKGEISKELIDPEIETDPARLFTVKARATIIRDYLFKGANLYVVYPKEGFNQRTEEQRKIYTEELAKHSTHLFDVPLNCSSIPNELVGATYLFRDGAGNEFVFAIKMTQAKDSQEIGEFGLWFGSMDHPAIQKRVKAVLDYIEQNSEVAPQGG